MPISIIQNGVTAYHSMQDAIDNAAGGTADSPVTITITVNEDITIDSTITLDGDKHIKLVPGNGTRKISRASAGGNLFTVKGGASLTLKGDGGNELIIDGDNMTASGSLVYVDGGTFTMHDGSVLKNNASTANGGGVRVEGSVFTMSGGTISGNTGGDGGGVHLYRSAIFTMTGGCIEGNTGSNGGGVNLGSNGDIDITFIFSGGVIQNNTATSTSTSYGGGGITVVRGTVNMSGNAVIRANRAKGTGGGVAVQYVGTFTKTGGAVYGDNADNEDDANHAEGGGHALYRHSGSVTIDNAPFAGTSWDNSF
jgi:hypothetical protein